MREGEGKKVFQVHDADELAPRTLSRRGDGVRALLRGLIRAFPARRFRWALPAAAQTNDNNNILVSFVPS